MEGADKPLPVQIAHTLGGWFVGQLKIAGILMVLYMAGFAIARVPWWGLLGLICGAANIIPFLGPLIALGLPMLAVLFADGEAMDYVAVLIVYVVVQGIEGFYLTPKILGRHLSLSPLTVFFAVLAGGLFFGFFGVLLAAPAAAVIAILWRATRKPPV